MDTRKEKCSEYDFTENTIMVHHTELSWASKEERRNMELYKRNIVKREIYRREGILQYRIIRTGANAS